MAFPLINRSLAELITPAIWNADVVANMNALGPHLQARKGSNQLVTSSTAFVNDADLQLPVGASDVWLLDFRLLWDGSPTGDLKVSFSLPTSGLITGFAAPPSGTTGSYQDAVWQSMTTSDSQAFAFPGVAAGTSRPLNLSITYTGGGTAGTVILRWAQNTSDGTATRVLAQSTLWVVKLA